MKTLATTIFICLFCKVNIAQSSDPIIISKALFVPAEKTVFHKIGDRNIAVKIFQYGDVNDFVCINVHANETSSYNAAKSVLEETGGTLIKIENTNQRVIKFRLNGITYGFDPNRIYSRIGIEQTLRDNRRTSKQAILEIEKFAGMLLQLIPDSTKCIIALHNNTEEAYSVRSYLPDGNRKNDAKAVYKDSTQDVDDIAFTTDSLLYQRMADFGFNSIWQDNEKVKKDGSLSVYCGENDKRYINIETQHGKVDQYVIMLEKLLLVLFDENKVPAEIPEKIEETSL
ncbi:MAG: hypothetical protein IPI78_07015 [Chitinophagaceae bacterium]|nr:hypothetical protein [Chitinophagaceae bacterium]